MQCPNNNTQRYTTSFQDTSFGSVQISISINGHNEGEKNRMEKHNKNYFRIANITIVEQTRLDHA